MDKFNVFISYSWKNSPVRESMVQALKDIDSLDVSYDAEVVSAEDESLWVKIREALNRSDIVIVFLTDESLASSAVIDELARAHDRGITIISVMDEKLSREDVRIPDYIKNKRHIPYKGGESIEHFKDFLRKEITNVIGKLKPYATRSLSDLRRTVVTEKREPVFDMILSEVISQTKLEAEEIIKKYYTINLGTEYDFLKRAAPLFASAKDIYAITVSRVSGFWTDPKNKHHAIKYLLSHKGNVIRIFVFDSPTAMLKYKEILDANLLQYGDRGAVFVTSVKKYIDEIIGYFFGDPDRAELLKSDFGVLSYAEKNKLFAWLSDGFLGFKPATNPPKQLAVDAVSFQKFLVMLKDQCDDGYNQRFGVWRWSKKTESKDEMKKCIASLFGNTLGDIVHLVLFKKYDESLATVISKVRHNIEELTAVYGMSLNGFTCTDVWYGQNIFERISERDAYSGGGLKHNSDYRYLLYMRLPSIDDLKGWYQYERHSSMRREIYSKLEKGISQLYAKMDKLEADGNAKRITGADVKSGLKNIYEQIEDSVSRKMSRMDYQDIEGIESMMTIKPYPFVKNYMKAKLVENAE